MRAWGIAIIPILAVAYAGSAAANDTAVQLATGGLEFVRNDAVTMVSEDLFISMDEIRVVYQFENRSAVDQSILIAFPMPEMTNSWYEIVSFPTDDPENIFDFSTTFNGVPVAATLHQYAFAMGVDRTKELRQLAIPLAPHLSTTANRLDAIVPADVDTLVALGIVNRESYLDGDREIVTHYPNWTLQSAYIWDATFPAGETVEVVHRYRPSVGGTTGVTFLDPAFSETLAQYESQYCVDAPILSTLRNSLTDPDQYWSAPYMENWVSYVLATGANWAGPIERFRLVVDKGNERNLVSFCGENVRRIGPTTFEMVVEDFYPFEDLELLFLVRHDADF